MHPIAVTNRIWVLKKIIYYARDDNERQKYSDELTLLQNAVLTWPKKEKP